MHWHPRLSRANSRRNQNIESEQLHEAQSIHSGPWLPLSQDLYRYDEPIQRHCLEWQIYERLWMHWWIEAFDHWTSNPLDVAGARRILPQILVWYKEGTPQWHWDRASSWVAPLAPIMWQRITSAVHSSIQAPSIRFINRSRTYKVDKNVSHKTAFKRKGATMQEWMRLVQYLQKENSSCE